jgi:hypothetical protein
MNVSKETAMDSLMVFNVKGSAISLSPITHGEIVSKEEENNIKAFRLAPFIDSSKREITRQDVPAISGNSFRGVGHRALFDLTMKILGISINDLFDMRVSEAEKRFVLLFLRVGGVASKGYSSVGGSSEEYRQLARVLSIVDLLGGCYHGHMIEGKLRMGFLYPLIQETAGTLVPSMTAFEKDGLPTLDDLKPATLRFMRKREPGEVIADEEDDSEATDDGTTGNGNTPPDKQKEGALFGFEVIPAGVRFTQDVTMLNAGENPGTMLALRAMLGLIKSNGTVGGSSGKGFGKIAITYQDKDDKDVGTTGDIEAYVNYVDKHRGEILAAIKELPETLKHVSKEQKAKAAKEKKAVKANAAANAADTDDPKPKDTRSRKPKDAKGSDMVPTIAESSGVVQ